MMRQALIVSVHFLFALTVLGVFEPPVYAATIAAATCENKSGQTDVQTAINAATVGDTVTVPAGNCTWTTTVTITNKGVTLTGAGIGSTNITDQGASSAALIVAVNSVANFVDISGFTFIKSTNHSNGIVQISGTYYVQAFRFHHNRILFGSIGSRGMTVTEVYGLIDNNQFEVTAASGSIQQVTIYGDDNNHGGGHYPWRETLNLGSSEAVYIEQNTFTNVTTNHAESALDAAAGAKVVARYNTVNDVEVGGGHGTDSGNRRSQILAEVYRNTYTINGNSGNIRAQGFRGGTGFIFQNTYTENGTGIWYGPQLLLYRAGEVPPASAWGHCDGTNLALSSTNPANIGSRTGTVGGTVFFDDATNSLLGSGAGYSQYLDGAGTGGYPCRDQPGRGPTQALVPFYSWNETRSIDAPDVWGGDYNGLGAANYILADRDFYSYSTATGATQTTGVRVGTAATMATVTTCTQGVGFWVTDEGEWDNTNGATADGRLYRCGASNNWTLYYTPYTYPHPMQGADSPPAPDPLTDAGRIMSFSGSTFAIFTWPRSTDAAHKQYNVYRCLTSDACTVLVYSVTPAQAASRLTPDTQFYDTSLYAGDTYYYSVSDVNTSDYVGPASTPVSITVTGKQ